MAISPDHAAIACCVLILGVLWKNRVRSKLPLPPSPPGLPLLGNVLDLPKDNEWLKYHQMCQELSERSPQDSTVTMTNYLSF
jgi:hypothetical protein